MLHVQHHVAGLGRLLMDGEFHVPAHHHPGQLRLGGVGDVDGAHVFALAEDGTAVRHRHDLVELVGDKENGLALGGQILHDLQQLVDFLGRQHGGRLVENQDVVVPVEHFQDFRPLLHAHGNILDQRVGVHLQPVFFRQGQHLLPGLLLLQKSRFSRRLHAQNDVVQHGEAFHQLEVLVHHADAQGIGVVGIVNLHPDAVLADEALLRLIHPEEDAHQRGFPGAVFAQQSVNFAVPELQGHVIVGHDAGEPLGDVHHLDGVAFLIQSDYLLWQPALRCFYYTGYTYRFQIVSESFLSFFWQKRTTNSPPAREKTCIPPPCPV